MKRYAVARAMAAAMLASTLLAGLAAANPPASHEKAKGGDRRPREGQGGPCHECNDSNDQAHRAALPNRRAKRPVLLDGQGRRINSHGTWPILAKKTPKTDTFDRELGDNGAQ